MLFQAARIIAATVEALRIEPAEVLDARQRDGDEAIQKLVHAVAAQGHLGAKGHALAHLEGGDGLSRRGEQRLLACNQCKIFGGILDLLAVGRCLADTHIEHDFLELGHLHAILIAELFNKRVADHSLVVRFHARPIVLGTRLYFARSGSLCLCLGVGLRLAVSFGSLFAASGRCRGRLLSALLGFLLVCHGLVLLRNGLA